MSDTGSNADPSEAPPSIGTYEGDRAATGERHGKGRNTFPNGDVYEGEYHAGLRHGTGSYTWKRPKARYVGSYAENLRHGQGAMVYPDGSRYKGQWVKGKREGTGSYVYVNGDVYVGAWKEDLKDGEGIYVFAETGSKIKGHWQNNFLTGPAAIVHKDHIVKGNYAHVKETSPVDPEDDTLGTKDTITGAKLELPCSLLFKSTGYVVDKCTVPEQVGLGAPAIAANDE
ncbi:hypothetical protein BC828DRAFT_364761 [Blastocladiella britannica]|nr:hypothetical protein BC828DRAFT_364761 [Blastocladiella britannica]